MLRSMRGRRIVGAVVVAWLVAVPGVGHAQRLQRSSDAVRGRGDAHVVVRPRGGSGGSGGGGGGVVVRPPPARGGGGGGSMARPAHGRSAAGGGGSSTPDAYVDAPPVDAGGQTTPPAQTYTGSPRRVWQPWGGEAWTPPPAAVTTATTTVVVERQVAPEAPRDPMYGGSAGVRLVAPIGPAPRVTEPVPGPAAGTLVPLEDEVDAVATPAVQGVIAADAGYVFDDIARVTVAGRIELPWRLDVVLGYTGFLEPRDTGFDAIAIGRLGLGARLIDEEIAQLRVALAVRHFQDWIGPQFGVDGVLGVDVDVYESVVLGLEGSFGTLGETFSAQARATLGVRIDSVEVFAGYEHLVLQPFDSEQRAVELGGPMIGILVVVR